MTRVVDEAARTLAHAQGCVDWDVLAPEAQERFRSDVRAVLAVLHDPDTVMAEAGVEIIRTVGPAESDAAHCSEAAAT